MPHNLALFTNITVALLVAFLGGTLASMVRLPTMVGYLLAGLVIGPFTPGFVGDVVDIGQLAEIGVIFMLFGVGLHFSLKDLWAVRRVAIPGAILQTLIATLVGYGLTRLWGWTTGAGLVVGLAVSIASTVVLLRGLMDNGLLRTVHGQVAVGWLIFEDLATVAILVLMPVLAGNGGSNPLQSAGQAVLGTVLFVALMLFIGKQFLPWLLRRIAFTRSRELFILAVVALALGTAFGAAELFGVSLALGAFLAGVVIGESDLGHQVGAEILPLREIFTVLFFVSVGMLANPASLLAHWGQVVAYTGLVMVGKTIITLLLGLVLPASLRTMVVVAAGLSQIGEFSFLVGQAGLSLGLLTQEQYGLILAGALLSILFNPFMFKIMLRLEPWLARLPGFGAVFRRRTPSVAPVPEGLAGHVVVVGYGRVGEHIVTVLERLQVPCLVVEADAARAAGFQQRGMLTLFGDAANSELLTHAHLPDARALVITMPDETAAEMTVATARTLAPDLPIIARAGTREGVHRLAEHGAQDVIHPELEGGLEIVRHALLRLDYPPGQVQEYIDAVRRDAYDVSLNRPEEVTLLDQLLATVRGITVAWRRVGPASPVVGMTIAEANLRSKTGASIIALVRNHEMVANPKSNVPFVAGDLVGMLGDAEQIAAAEHFLNPGLSLSPEGDRLGAMLHRPVQA
jgi:CPA2 family monovalent cation:H+ antiporter-2